MDLMEVTNLPRHQHQAAIHRRASGHLANGRYRDLRPNHEQEGDAPKELAARVVHGCSPVDTPRRHLSPLHGRESTKFLVARRHVESRAEPRAYTTAEVQSQIDRCDSDPYVIWHLSLHKFL